MSLATAAALLLGGSEASACTSAIIAAEATTDGRPLLWKNRDTSATDNKVEYIAPGDGRFAYTALFNASDKECKEAWIGMNEVGFAIMNTASYNLKDDRVPNSKMDKEGLLMSIALQTCTTVDDFELLLQKLPRPLGVEANFGVIDAEGSGAFFETNNHSFVRYDLKDAPSGVLVRTNYSHSGRKGEGYGFTREENACTLLEPYARTHSITPELLTETLSRSFYNSTLQRDFASERGPVVDNDFIPRFKTTATIVVEGCHPIENVGELKRGALADQYIMWTALGYPPCAEIVPVWCKPGGVEEGLRGLEEGGKSRLNNESLQRRDKVFTRPGGEKEHYINMGELFNDSDTGICQTLRRQNLETYKVIKAKRDGRR